MSRRLLLSTVAALAFIQPLSAFADGGFSNSPMKSITLSSGGLAEIRRTTTIDGNGEIRIEVPLDQVNDILKSLVVFDTKGTVKDLSLAGPNPLEETFKNLPFSPDDLSSLPKLLMSLKGAKVSVEGTNKGEGTILGVETESEAQGAKTNYLNLIDGDGLIKRYELNATTTVRFSDPAVREKIASAITVVGNNVTDTARSVVVKIDGKGKRAVDFSYVVAAPIWKTSYRVVVGDDGKARLQAWAILENATGEDWKDVGIVLNSSSPVTLTQRLHDRYMKHRDELPIVVDNLGIPDADRGGLNQMADMEAPRFARSAVAPTPMMAETMMMKGGPEMSYAQSATSSEGDISATFKLDGTYDIRNGDTVSVPIVDKEVKAELVSLYRLDRGDRHPISAVSLENTTGVSLPGGILTVFDRKGAYVGDSSLLGLPNGDIRMSSFALDKKVEVETRNDAGVKTVEIKVVDGILVTKNVMREETVYVVHGAADDDRTVIVEHPKRGDGWEFTSPEKVGESATDYRLKVKVAKGETREVKAVYQRSGGESFQLAELGANDLLQWSSTSLDPVIKDKLNELARAKKDEAETQRQLDRAAEEHAAMQATQERTRENLKVMPAGSDQQKEYVTKLSDIEARLDENEAKQSGLRETLSKYTTRVGDIIRTF